MEENRLARDVLWDLAESQHGYFTAAQAREQGVSNQAVVMLCNRKTIKRATVGVYRFPKFPSSQFDPYMLAVLWTMAPEACLSHETALDIYGISDINPNLIHITVAKNRRIRRKNDAGYVIHNQDLTAADIGWWQEIPTVTPAVAIKNALNMAHRLT